MSRSDKIVMIFRPKHAVAYMSSYADAITPPTWGLFYNQYSTVLYSEIFVWYFWQLGVALSMDIPLALGPIFFLAITTAAVQYTIPPDEW